jgi:hypothetical protein
MVPWMPKGSDAWCGLITIKQLEAYARGKERL